MIVIPCFLTPFSHIFIFYLLFFYCFFSYFSFYFILKIYITIRILQHLKGWQMDYFLCLELFFSLVLAVHFLLFWLLNIGSFPFIFLIIMILIQQIYFSIWKFYDIIDLIFNLCIHREIPWVEWRQMKINWELKLYLWTQLYGKYSKKY